MVDQKQLYLELYKENRIEQRHHEAQRSTVATIFVALASAMVGLSFSEKTRDAKPYLGVLLVNFCFIGIIVINKLYERFRLARERAIHCLEEIDNLCGKGFNSAGKRPSLVQLNGEGLDIVEKQYPLLRGVRLHRAWTAILFGAILVGITFSVPSLSLKAKTVFNQYPEVVFWAGPACQCVLLMIVRAWDDRKEKKYRKETEERRRKPQNDKTFRSLTTTFLGPRNSVATVSGLRSRCRRS